MPVQMFLESCYKVVIQGYLRTVFTINKPRLLNNTYTAMSLTTIIDCLSNEQQINLPCSPLASHRILGELKFQKFPGPEVSVSLSVEITQIAQN